MNICIYVCVIALCVKTSSSSVTVTPTQLQFSAPGEQQAAESEKQYVNEVEQIVKNSGADCAKVHTSMCMQVCVYLYVYLDFTANGIAEWRNNFLVHAISMRVNMIIYFAPKYSNL